MKRALDLCAVLLLSPFWIPLFLLLALIVYLSLGRPVFFRQRRIGRGGQPFDLIKFRTMTDSRDVNGVLLPDTERTPRFGRLLRSTSLDEIPELWLVLTGKMSLVGPRPLLPHYLPYYSTEEQLRHTVRPGLTGLAQIEGRNALGWDERLALDVEYVRRRSLLFDLGILLRTLPAVLFRKGINASPELTAPDLAEERKARQHPPES